MSTTSRVKSPAAVSLKLTLSDGLSLLLPGQGNRLGGRAHFPRNLYCLSKSWTDQVGKPVAPATNLLAFNLKDCL